MSKKIFEEKQRFNQWWLWLTLVGLIAIFFYQRLPLELNQEFFISFGMLALVVGFLLSIQLFTRVDEHGIHIKMFPFHLKTVSYAWTDLYSAEVVEYSPIAEYGGWGLRISRKGKAFNVKGNKGIKIQTSDGRSRMIGTQKFEEAKEVVVSYQGKMK
jgi:hypothetical protein